jgi:hypothetical protein
MKKKTPMTADIAVEPPLTYPVLEKAPGAPPGSKKAVLITHGMGQQKSFETLNQVVEGLRRATDSHGATMRQKVRYVQIGGERLYRVELEIQSQDKKQQVDLYEAYWAPLTEGQVSLRDVVRFFWNAGISGMKNAFDPPTQRRFGQRVPMPPTRSTLGQLILTLVILLSLIVMNASIVAVGSARSLYAGESAWLSETLFLDLSVVFNVLLLFLIPMGSILIVASWQKSAARPGTGGTGSISNRCIWASLIITSAATIILGFVNLLVLLNDRTSAGSDYIAEFFPITPLLSDVRASVAALGLLSVVLVMAANRFRSSRVAGGLILSILVSGCFVGEVLGFLSILSRPFPGMVDSTHAVLVRFLPEECSSLRSSLWLWPFLILIAFQVRILFVQYVGDVAAYISPDQLDRFNEIRRKIKEQARETAAAIYSAKDLQGGGYEYGEIALVGHSLGSVISYDTLNRLVKDDEAAGNPRDVLGRTKLLLTFGSPLDKTSFVFALHGKEATATREALVAAVQPLIQDYRYRPFRWVNIWSPNDVISGKLDYYDADPPNPQRRVINEPDPECTTPLLAHTEYWKNQLVWEKLYQALV